MSAFNVNVFKRERDPFPPNRKMGPVPPQSRQVSRDGKTRFFSTPSPEEHPEDIAHRPAPPRSSFPILNNRRLSQICPFLDPKGGRSRQLARVGQENVTIILDFPEPCRRLGKKTLNACGGDYVWKRLSNISTPLTVGLSAPCGEEWMPASASSTEFMFLWWCLIPSFELHSVRGIPCTEDPNKNEMHSLRGFPRTEDF